ncbi:MAG: methyltransferase [Oceanospirillaceae bacterium]
MNNASSFELLFASFSKATTKSLWILDENPPLNFPPSTDNIEIISNRFDVVQRMQALGFKAYFSDFDFSELLQNSYQFIFYRISKEKALAHYIINKAHNLMKTDGSLIISGAKQEGIKGYIERATKLYPHVEVFKADKQHWGASFNQVELLTNHLDDKNYTQLRSISDKQPNTELRFVSKPGVFGWNKIDQGSKLLIEHLPTVFKHLSTPEKVLDIGCGYGYLSVHCARLFNCEVTACDNNAAAIIACSENLSTIEKDYQVISTDCTADIQQKFDLIVCNPPFHTGFNVENDLTKRFLKGTADCLSSNGIAIFVVNLHIPLAREAEHYFKNITTVSDDKHFKVITLSNL